MPQAKITINAVPGSNPDLPINVLVQLNNVNIGGEVSYKWEILDQPAGPPDVLSSTVIQNPTFTPKKEGSYLLRLTVNASLVSEQIDTAIAAVRLLKSRRRVPAAGETTQVDPIDGWAPDADAIDLALDDKLAHPADIVGVNVSGGTIAHNTVLRVTSSEIIKPGLPGQEVVPGFTPALATLSTNVDELLFLADFGVDGSDPIPNGALMRAHIISPEQDIPLGAGVVGDPVFVSNTGALSVTPGTIRRQVGSIIAIGAGANRDVFFDGVGGIAITPIDRGYLVYGNPGTLTNAHRVDGGFATPGATGGNPYEFKAGDNATVALAAKRFSNTGFNIFEAQTESGSVLDRIDALGNLEISRGLNIGPFFGTPVSGTLGIVDANFTLSLNAANPQVAFNGPGSALLFNRASAFMSFNVSANENLRIGAAQAELVVGLNLGFAYGSVAVVAGSLQASNKFSFGANTGGAIATVLGLPSTGMIYRPAGQYGLVVQGTTGSGSTDIVLFQSDGTANQRAAQWRVSNGGTMRLRALNDAGATAFELMKANLANGYLSTALRFGIGAADPSFPFHIQSDAGGTLGVGAGNVDDIATIEYLSANTDQLKFSALRMVAGGSHTTVGDYYQRKVDSTYKSFLAFFGSAALSTTSGWTAVGEGVGLGSPSSATQGGSPTVVVDATTLYIGDQDYWMSLSGGTNPAINFKTGGQQMLFTRSTNRLSFAITGPLNLPVIGAPSGLTGDLYFNDPGGTGGKKLSGHNGVAFERYLPITLVAGPTSTGALAGGTTFTSTGFTAPANSLTVGSVVKAFARGRVTAVTGAAALEIGFSAFGAASLSSGNIIAGVAVGAVFQIEMSALIVAGPQSTWTGRFFTATAALTVVGNDTIGGGSPTAVTLSATQAFAVQVRNNGAGGTSMTASIDQEIYMVT